MKKHLIFIGCALLSLDTLANESGSYSPEQTNQHLTYPAEPNNPPRAEELGTSLNNETLQLVRHPENRSRTPFAPAQYNTWQTVEMGRHTGSMCMDGSPYKIFVNRVPSTSNLLIYFEPGGVCTDHASCTGKGENAAANPRGIPDNYMTHFYDLRWRTISPLVARAHPMSRIKTQQWNIIYAPYCSGDLHAGNRPYMYFVDENDPKSEHVQIEHRGLKNARSVVSWARANLERPAQLFVAGASAGGAGAMLNYPHLRKDLSPDYAYLLNDSGPLFQITDSDAPSAAMYNMAKKNFDFTGSYFKFIQGYLPTSQVNPDNPISLYAANSIAFPSDRMAMTYFQMDKTYPRYSYQRHKDVISAQTEEEKDQAALALSKVDITALYENLANLSNFGAYFPQYRGFWGSHMLTTLDFRQSDIQEQGTDLNDFLKNLLDGQGKVMYARELDASADLSRSFYYNSDFVIAPWYVTTDVISHSVQSAVSMLPTPIQSTIHYASMPVRYTLGAAQSVLSVASAPLRYVASFLPFW